MRATLFAFAALMFLPGYTRAEIVIDNFSPGATSIVGPAGPVSYVLNDDVSGTRETTVSANGQVIFGNNAYQFNSGLAGVDFTMLYNLAAPMNFTTSGSRSLLLDLFTSVGGTYTLNVSFGSTLAGATEAFAPISVANVGVRSVDGATLANQALAASVDRISINIRKDTPNFFSVLSRATAAKISAVPEPASFALLGLTGVGGFVAMRRRAVKPKASNIVA